MNAASLFRPKELQRPVCLALTFGRAKGEPTRSEDIFQLCNPIFAVNILLKKKCFGELLSKFRTWLLLKSRQNSLSREVSYRQHPFSAHPPMHFEQATAFTVSMLFTVSFQKREIVRWKNGVLIFPSPPLPLSLSLFQSQLV